MSKRTKKTSATTQTGTEIALVASEKKPPRKRTTKVAESQTTPKTEPDPTVTENATPGDETCVFAIRLLRSERDLIHQVAGSGKATSFVKGIALAAARADIDEVHRIVGEIARRK